ncbi:LAGLIDADG family homing endonuclease [Priestia endophytica]
MADMHNKPNVRYSKNEIEILKKYYPIGGYKEVQKFLPHRNKKSISEKARALGVKTQNQKIAYSNSEKELIKEYYPIGGAKLVQEKLGKHRHIDSIRRVASSLGVNGTTAYFESREDEIIKTHYPKNGYEKVLELLPHRDKSSIQQRAHKLGVSFLSYNENYFEEIDTPEKAYWLGFMYTDGYVTTNNRWGVTLGIKDIDHLKKFTDAFNCNINLKTRKRLSKFEETLGKEYEECSFVINNSKMHSDLISKGVISNKTKTMTFPSSDIIPNKFTNHFIRGLFDGDGSYCVMTNKQTYKDRIYNVTSCEISFVCGSKQFIDQLGEVISINTGIKIRINKSSKKELYTLRISNKKDLLKFIEYIYDEKEDKLERKYLKAQEIINHCLS